MKLPFRPPLKKKKTLQAATARRPREADFTEEPSVKLSSAFVVVLILHIVAVGGIYAFSALKGQAPAFDDPDTAQTPQNAQVAASPAPAAESATSEEKPAAPAPTLFYRVKSGDTIARIAMAYGVTAEGIIDLNNVRQTGGIHVGEELQLPKGAALAADDQPEAPKPASPRNSGNTYTVVHGDTLAGIARKLHVSREELLRLNNIEEPKRLKIGLKLKVPVRRQPATIAQAA